MATFVPPHDPCEPARTRIWQQLLEERELELQQAGWWRRYRIRSQMRSELEVRLAREIPGYAKYKAVGNWGHSPVLWLR